jgi:4-hydroxythreonine-4-phosphate dehydrogenase
VIAPAIALANTQGLQVSGPFPPDTVFMQAHQASGADAPDVVLAMYHDQGLIPVKFLGIEHGVNQTLGLPFVRTSPDHGTAFDIAGQGLADPSSLLAAVRAARSSP